MKVFPTIWLLLIGFGAYSQDIHFSQFFFSPQTLNPAEIGNTPSQYRLNANQKTQWRSVSQPYNTFALMGDGKFDFLPEDVAVGALIMNDRAGDSRFNTFSFLVAGSYKYALTDDGMHVVRGGLQTGFTQISIDEDALSFNNQFNGVAYDPNLPTGENFRRNSRTYFNLNIGAAYTYTKAPEKSATAGIALHNLNGADQSFFNDTGVNLPLRSSFYVTADWKINDDFDVMPAFRYMDQATFGETIFGTAVRYTLMDERSLYRSVFAGYFGRFNDSGIAMLGFELDQWRFAASYDINVSDLVAASRNQGGLEFSLQYLFGENERNTNFMHKYCPVYL